MSVRDWRKWNEKNQCNQPRSAAQRTHHFGLHVSVKCEKEVYPKCIPVKYYY